jgi:hypothetical protein
MRKTTGIMLFILLAVFLIGCTPGPNGYVNSAGANGFVPGFWQGLWNGMIAPVTLVISVFNKHIQMYEVHNAGGWYNFGFLLGIIAIWGGGAGGAAARRSRS